MPFCTNCGAELVDSANFCPSCGSRKGAAPGGQQTGAQQEYNNYQQQGYGPQSNGQPYDDVAANKGISVLCYLGILFLVPLLTRPDSDFVKFHSNQGIVLLLFCVILGVVGRIPLLGWLTDAVGGLFAAVCLIMGIANVLNGEKKELPLIGKIKILN